jgi:hypothetical protein
MTLASPPRLNDVSPPTPPPRAAGVIASPQAATLLCWAILLPHHRRTARWVPPPPYLAQCTPYPFLMLPPLEPLHLGCRATARRCATADALHVVTAPVECRARTMRVCTWIGSIGFFGQSCPAQKALGRESACHCSSIFNIWIPLFLYLFPEIRSRF